MSIFKTIGNNRSTINYTKVPSFNLGTDIKVRQKSYEAFTNDSSLKKLTDQDKKAGVRVYSSMPFDEIKPTLSRKEGYAVPPDKRHKTKERVISSNAHYIGNSSGDFHPNDPVKCTMLTSCAPNLRKSDKGPENPGDYQHFVTSNGTLNENTYREEMKKVWTRFFFAANEEAKRTGKKIDIITPLAGGGAYLEGLSESERKKAVTIITQTMIESANIPSFQNIGEIHLSVPNQSNGKESRDLALIDKLMSNSSSQKTITLSNTDSLALGREITHSGKKIAICNPGSDHVPGGGSYNDRGKKLQNGGNDYNTNKGANSKNPGEFNDKPKALEEQLGQVSNFLYIQNKDQNPQNFDFVNIPKSILNTSSQQSALVGTQNVSMKGARFFTDSTRMTKNGTPCFEVSALKKDQVDNLKTLLQKANIQVYDLYEYKGYWRIKCERTTKALTLVNDILIKNPAQTLTQKNNVEVPDKQHNFKRKLQSVIGQSTPSMNKTLEDDVKNNNKGP